MVNDPNDIRVVPVALADEVGKLFSSICDRTGDELARNSDWGPSGRRRGQYSVDLVLDALCVEPLLAAGFTVLSEESGLQSPAGPDRGTVVVDPLDGSTNASLGLPWCATSLCLVVDGAAVVSTVANLVTGRRFTAVRGGGARRDGQPLGPLEDVDLSDAVVAMSGYPGHDYGWRQFRAMGASALDLCEVATGAFDGFLDMNDAHGVWDYLGAALVVEEAGGVVADVLGRDLLVLDPDARRAPAAASSEALLEELVRHRVAGDGHRDPASSD